MRQVFTFGFSHVSPYTGESLARCYVVIEAEDPREEMVRAFGTKWAFEYRDEFAAGVGPYGLRRVSMPTETEIRLQARIERLRSYTNWLWAVENYEAGNGPEPGDSPTMEEGDLPDTPPSLPERRFRSGDEGEYSMYPRVREEEQ